MQDKFSRKVIGCAIEVHRTLGPGLLESAYEACQAYELDRAGLGFARQATLTVKYKNTSIDILFRADFIIEGELLLELKATELLTRVHEAQILSYLKLADLKMGLLINFNVVLLRSGLRRFIL